MPDNEAVTPNSALLTVDQAAGIYNEAFSKGEQEGGARCFGRDAGVMAVAVAQDKKSREAAPWISVTERLPEKTDRVLVWASTPFRMNGESGMMGHCGTAMFYEPADAVFGRWLIGS